MIILKGNPDNKEVALIFDDGPNPLVTPKMLKVLKDKDVPANFFLIGMRAEQSPELVNQIVEAGHEIGNHTYTHKRLTKVLEEQGEQVVIDEVAKGKQTLETITGLNEGQIKFLRPPYLDWNDEVAEVIKPIYGDNIMMGLALQDWNWGIDRVWDEDDTTGIQGQALRIVEDWQKIAGAGTLLGLHDSAEYNLPGNKQNDQWMNRALPTLEAIPHIIDFLQAKGLTLKRLSDMNLVKEEYVKR